MARTVTGVLRLPNGTAMASAKVIFTARATTATLIAGSCAVFEAAVDGTYAWSVEEGAYGVSVQYGGRRWPLGDVMVAAGDPIDLDDLLTE